MSTQQFKKVSPLSRVPHDIFPVVSGRHKPNSDESVERKEWSTYLTIPGIMQPILITLPSMKLPVCNKCKGQFKTRKYCRLEPRTHMSLPWSTVYLCLTFDDSCYDVNSDSGMEIRRLKTNESFTAKIAEFDSSSTSRNKWRPFVIRENSQTSPLKKKERECSDTGKAASAFAFALSNTKNSNSCIDSSAAEDLTDTLPMCMDCKKKRYTGTFCRGKASPHMYLPWSTVYYDIFCNNKKVEEENPKDDDEEEEEEKNHDIKSSSQIVINSAEENVCLSSSTRVKISDSLNSTLKKDTTFAAVDNLEIPNIFDNLTGPCSKTLFVHMSAKECKFEWVDYDNEKASRMHFDNESESKSFKLQKKSSPKKKTCETNEDEEEDHKYDVMPSLPRHNNSHGGHQHYPHHDPYLYSSHHHLHHHVFHPVVHSSYHTRRDNGYNFYYPTCRHSPYNPPQHPQHPHHHGGFIDSATSPVPHAPPQLYHQGNSNNNNNNNKRSFHHIMDSTSPHNHYSSQYYNPGSPPNSSRYSPRNYSPIRIRQQPQQQHYHVGAPMDVPIMAPPTQRINHPTRVVGSSRPSTRQYHEKRNHIMERRRRDSDGSTIHNIHDEFEPHQFQPQLQQTQVVTQSQFKIEEEERIYHHQQQQQQQHQQERNNNNKRPRLSSDYSLNNDFDGAPVVEEGKSKDNNKNESSSKSQWGENPFMSVYQYE